MKRILIKEAIKGNLKAYDGDTTLYMFQNNKTALKAAKISEIKYRRNTR